MMADAAEETSEGGGGGSLRATRLNGGGEQERLRFTPGCRPDLVEIGAVSALLVRRPGISRTWRLSSPASVMAEAERAASPRCWIAWLSIAGDAECRQILEILRILQLDGVERRARNRRRLRRRVRRGPDQFLSLAPVTYGSGRRPHFGLVRRPRRMLLAAVTSIARASWCRRGASAVCSSAWPACCRLDCARALVRREHLASTSLGTSPSIRRRAPGWRSARAAWPRHALADLGFFPMIVDYAGLA